MKEDKSGASRKEGQSHVSRPEMMGVEAQQALEPPRRADRIIDRAENFELPFQLKRT